MPYVKHLSTRVCVGSSCANSAVRLAPAGDLVSDVVAYQDKASLIRSRHGFSCSDDMSALIASVRG